MSALVLRDATVVSVDEQIGVLARANILVADGSIVEIAPDLEVPAGCHEVSAAGRIAIPGLINAHVHLW